MSMSFIAGAAIAVTIGGIVIGGIAASDGDNAFEPIRPIAPPEASRAAPQPRALFIQGRRAVQEAEPSFGRSEPDGERFRYAD